MEPQLKQHITVNAAYVEALCMCSHVHEAMRAFEQMLELYAAQYHPERSQEAGTHSHHLRTQSIALTKNRHGSSSIDMQQPSDSYNCSHPAQALEQRRSGVGGAADEQLGATGQESSCASAAEPASVAQRAAQAACHQILNAAAREGLATMSTDVLRALHQVQQAVIPCRRRPGSWAASEGLNHTPLHQLSLAVITGVLVPSYEEGDVAVFSPDSAEYVLRLRRPCRLACSQTLPSTTAS